MEDNLLIYIDKLPDELIDIIKEYIPLEVTIFLNKALYLKNHCVIKQFISNYESYIRDMVRKNNDFVFEQICKENFKKWLFIKKYHYKSIIFSNYIYFLLYFCNENNSSQCREIIKSHLTQHGLIEKQHKKNIIKHIRWKH